MKRSMKLALGMLLVLAIAGCATTEQPMAQRPGATPDVVAERQRIMKLHGALWKDIQDKAKAGQIEAIAVSAEAMALSAQRIPGVFPQGSLTDKSKAKPDVWQKFPEFEAAAKNFETQSVKLRDVAKSKNAAATQAVMKDFGKNACGACHTPFRQPPPKKS